MTNNNQSFNIEEMIINIQQIINKHEQEIANHKKMLQPLIEKWKEIKKNMKLNNQNNAEHSEINTK